MPTINELSAVDELAAGDSIPVYSTTNGDARRAALSVFKSYMEDNLTVARLVTQYAAPSATGFSVTIDEGNTHLILTPDAGYATGTIVLPAASDRDEVLVNSTEAVTTLSMSGGTVIGGPSTLAANDFFRLKYDALLARWYRVG